MDSEGREPQPGQLVAKTVQPGERGVRGQTREIGRENQQDLATDWVDCEDGEMVKVGRCGGSGSRVGARRRYSLSAGCPSRSSTMQVPRGRKRYHPVLKCSTAALPKGTVQDDGTVLYLSCPIWLLSAMCGYCALGSYNWGSEFFILFNSNYFRLTVT